MSVLIKLDAAGTAYIADGVGAAAPAAVEATPRVVEGGRGDARIATYVKKPPPADAKARDWRDDGFVPLTEWLAGDRVAAPIVLPTDDPMLPGDHLAEPLIGIAFPKFNDGRGLSLAVLLRKRLGYSGDLRAVGDVARDQLFFMARCGLTSFALRADQDPADALKAFTDFSDVYQDAADGRAPLFRRRAP